MKLPLFVGTGVSAGNGFLNGLISYYKSDTNGSFPDAHGSNDGILFGPTFNASGKNNGAYSFATNDYVDINSLASSLSNKTQGTFAAWVKLPDATPSGDMMILGFGDTNGDTRMQFDIAGGNSGKLRVFFEIGGINKFLLETPTGPLTNGVYARIGLVQDGISPVLYFNGVAITQSFTVDVDRTVWFNNAPLIDNGRIGALNYGSIGNHKFLTGDVDEIPIRDRPLTADEMLEDYNSGAGIYYDSFTT